MKSSVSANVTLHVGPPDSPCSFQPVLQSIAKQFQAHSVFLGSCSSAAWKLFKIQPAITFTCIYFFTSHYQPIGPVRLYSL